MNASTEATRQQVAARVRPADPRLPPGGALCYPAERTGLVGLLEWGTSLRRGEPVAAQPPRTSRPRVAARPRRRAETARASRSCRLSAGALAKCRLPHLSRRCLANLVCEVPREEVMAASIDGSGQVRSHRLRLHSSDWASPPGDVRVALHDGFHPFGDPTGGCSCAPTSGTPGHDLHRSLLGAAAHRQRSLLRLVSAWSSPSGEPRLDPRRAVGVRPPGCIPARDAAE